MKIERFEDTDAWQLVRELTRKVYGLAKKAEFARGFGLKNQIQDAAGSSMHNVRCFVCLILFIITACTSGGDGTFHEGMFGVWETEELRYQNCYIEIQEEKIIFYNSEKGMDLYRISGIEAIPKVSRTLYHIRYKDNEGLEYLLSLFFMHTAKGDYLQFQNQMEFQWSKRKDIPE